MTGRSRSPFPFPLLRFWFWRILPAWGGIALAIFLVQIIVCGIIHDNENVKTLLKFLDLLVQGVSLLDEVGELGLASLEFCDQLLDTDICKGCSWHDGFLSSGG